MSLGKRLFDLALALVLGALLLVPVLGICLWLLVAQGRPIFYAAERMKTPTRAFRLWKFRTMTVAAADSGVSGGDKALRITRPGRFLRRTRLDEAPQLWNVLKGDMSFVGPRPPLRTYVERFPALYARVLAAPPGLTGLATLHFRRHEERLLAACKTTEETDAVYARRCVPRKAQLDMIYHAQRSVCRDAVMIGQTLAQVLFRR